MKKLGSFLIISFILLSLALAQTDKWQVAKSTHFIVHFKNAEEDFIEKLIDRAEEYYNDIADNLGFRRYNFWLWENRAKIYICDDSQDYQNITKQPNWSSGCAIVREKIIYTFPNAKGFFDTILPHELGHIIFREFVGFDNPAIPFWLDEGVAGYQEKARYAQANSVVKKAIQDNKFISLENLSNFNLQTLEDNVLVSLIYAEAISLIDYLIKEFGIDNFVLFCQGLRDKKNLEGALRYAYPFREIKDLGRAWYNYLTE